ncbi:MAG: geranylgeranylglycerol-phosphate geranylgeranyltransferase [Vicingaceae bacterium]
MKPTEHTSQRRLIILKVISLLSLVRWYNILLIVIAQYLLSLFVINSPSSILSVILDYNLILLALSSSFIIAAGYIINGFYDSEKDMINRPEVALFNQLVSKPFRLYCFFGFNAVGVLLGLFISRYVFIFNLLFSAGLWLYSHKFKKVLFLGNISGTLLSIAAIFSICIYYRTITPFIVLYAGFIFLIELTREIVKDMEALKGDMIMGYATIPVELGMKSAKRIVLAIQLLSISIPFFLYSIKGVSFIMLYFLFSAGLIVASMIVLEPAEKKESFSRVNTIYKVILLTGIASVVLF